VVGPHHQEQTTHSVTRPQAAQVESDPRLAFETGFLSIPFDADGGLDQESLFPESVRARRRLVKEDDRWPVN
jgi:hypothetical protein